MTSRDETHHSSLVTRHSAQQRGFALVITLILLSVTLIMAVAFLAISRRERGSVVTSTDTATARYAADAALANAEAQIMSTALATTNPYINNLLVSTNYINANGFVSGSSNPTNVNYDYYNGGGTLLVNDFLQNVANLYFLPRVPVFVPTNNLGASDFRFYLDLNRNGNFEDSGALPVFGPNGLFLHPNGTEDNNRVNVVTNFQMGDPQWIGVLERPDAPHGPNNKFLARYAFIALPADSTLDLNAIHNQALQGNSASKVNPPPLNDTYFRNQGVGSWEINLAAFLADLNVNQWDPPTVENAANNPYQYIPPPLLGGNKGVAFEDARALLAYRYNNTFGSLAFVPALLPNYALPGSVDILTIGPAMVATAAPLYYPIPNNYLNQYLWPGTDNTNHFFALTSDLFDPNKTGLGVAPAQITANNYFTGHLLNAGNYVAANGVHPTYDRYTFYRLLSQLGTDSSPEAGKMNLNYDNLDPFRNGVYDTNTGVVSLTNFAAWTPLAFFTNAADRLLRLYTTNWFQADPPHYLATYYGFTNLGGYYTNNPGHYFYVDGLGNTINYDQGGSGLTNIPLYGMTNQIPAFGLPNIPVSINGRFVYSSAVQRVLQLAANIYDASTNSFYPSRFRPVFTVTNLLNSTGNLGVHVYVSGFVQQVNLVRQRGEFLTPDLALPADVTSLPQGMNMLTNVYGVPWIIGAKKGFPNFNEFSMENSIQVTRKLQVTRQTNTPPAAASNYKTNQMYSMCITNFYGLECWNSYFDKTNYTGRTGRSGPIVIMVRNLASMTLTNAIQFSPNQASTPLFPQTVFTTNYLTYTLNSWPSNLFVVPLSTNAAFFAFTNPVFVYKYNQIGSTENFLDPGILPLPQFGFCVTNYLQVAIIDYSASAIFGQIVDYVQLGPLRGSTRDINAEIADTTTTGLWSTNLVGGASGTMPYGVINQITTSRVGGKVPSEDTGEGYWNPNLPQLPAKLAGLINLQQAQQLFFTAFFSTKNTASYSSAVGNFTVTNLLSQMQAPYTPTRTRVQRLTWQANDPLVHYLASDLNDLADDTNAQFVVDWPYNLGMLNNRYQPWGGNPNLPGNPATPYDPRMASEKNMSLKDPGVTSSAQWDFPTNKFPTVGWLGRVHRGTPWQTVYLKASNPVRTGNGTNIWRTWTGNYNTADALNAGPVQDRLLFDIFTTAINDNATRGRLSVNVAAGTNDPAAGLAAWSAVFSGVAVPTNTTGGYTIIQPAGAAGLNSPLGEIVTNINYQRTFFTNATSPVGAYKHVGDILSVRALTEQSPFLSLTPTNNLNDELYEWLPQQTLSLLRAASEPRYVIYAYGQALKPAPNGVVTSGGPAYFGMVTNYQVVAETATRAVVQFRPVVVPVSVFAGVTNYSTNYNATIEQFNPLPPD